MKGILYFDGGARPTNPGHAGFASVLEIDGEEKVIARYVGWKTNNQAEYMGLIVGMKYALHLGVHDIEIYSDSQLVVNQVLGEWSVKEFKLKQMKRDAQDLLAQFDEAIIKWVRRMNNTSADSYCTSAINWGRNQNPLLPQSIKDKRPGAQQEPFGSASRAAGRVRPPAISSLLSSSRVNRVDRAAR